MDRRSVLAVSMSFVAGVVVAVSLVSPSRAQAGGAGKGAPATYVYYPGAGGNPGELLDTRSGALYKRGSSSWDLNVKPLDQE